LTKKNKVPSESEVSELGKAKDDDIETLKSTLADEREKAENYLTNWQRAEADFINYKKRAEQEKNELSDFANASLILNLLPALDDLDRAFASLSSKPEDNTWVDGIRLIYHKLQGTLEAQGLTEIKALGQAFDPNLHEAVAYQEGEKEIVIGETQKGYKLKDKVLRPTLVIVGKGKEEKTKE